VISGAEQVTGWSLYNSSRTSTALPCPSALRAASCSSTACARPAARSASEPERVHAERVLVRDRDPSYLSYTNASDIQIVDDNDWKQMRCPLSSITKTSSGGSSLNVNPSCFADNNTDVPNVGFPFNGNGLPAFDAISWIENAYQLLTSARPVLPRQQGRLPLLHPAVRPEHGHRRRRAARAPGARRPLRHARAPHPDQRQ
jgi:hypothetical protein